MASILLGHLNVSDESKYTVISFPTITGNSLINVTHSALKFKVKSSVWLNTQTLDLCDVISIELKWRKYIDEYKMIQMFISIRYRILRAINTCRFTDTFLNNRTPHEWGFKNIIKKGIFMNT